MLKFNKSGNLTQNLHLSFRKFLQEFGFNKKRAAFIMQLLVFCRTLNKYGIENVYIVGSLITNKEVPRDIDVCIDVTYFDYKGFQKDYPNVITEAGLETLRLSAGIHVAAMFNSYSTEDLDWYQFDRDKNFRGWVKISLFNLDIT